MRRTAMASCLWVLIAAVPGFARPDEAPKAKEPPAVVELLEDNLEPLIPLLNNDGGFDGSTISRDFRDFYSGVCSLRVGPFQRHSPRIQGWNYPIAEKPGPGQYRYVRFAWKRVGGAGIMIQFHNAASSWNQRYVA